MRTARSLPPLLEAARTVEVYARNALSDVKPVFDIKRLSAGCFDCEHAVGSIDGGKSLTTIAMGRNEDEIEIAFTLSHSDTGVKKSLVDGNWWLYSFLSTRRPQSTYVIENEFRTGGDNHLRPYVRLAWRDGGTRHINARIDLSELVEEMLEDQDAIFVQCVAFNYYGLYIEPGPDLPFWRTWGPEEIINNVRFSYSGFPSMTSRKSFVMNQWPEMEGGALQLTPLLTVKETRKQWKVIPAPPLLTDGQFAARLITTDTDNIQATIRWDDVATTTPFRVTANDE